MGARTLKQIESEIERLQQEAARIRAEESAAVISRIQAAIEYYGFQPSDLFGRSATSKRAAKNEKAPRTVRRTGNKRAATKPVPIKYRDAQGNTWTGRGLKPRWLTQSLAEGKRLEDFAI